MNSKLKMFFISVLLIILAIQVVLYYKTYKEAPKKESLTQLEETMEEMMELELEELQ